MDDLQAALAESDALLNQSRAKAQASAPAPKPRTGAPASQATQSSPTGKSDESGGIGGALTRIVTGASEGLINTVGAPVDLVNWGLKKVGLGSAHPIGGSDSIRSAFSNTIGYKKQGDASLGKSSGTAENVATEAANFLGGSIVPVGGLMGRGSYLIRAGGEGALKSTSASSRALSQMAIETAARPGLAVATEVGGAVGAAAGGEAAQDIAPDNEYAQMGAELVGGLVGGFGGASAAFRREAATGVDAEGRRIVGYGQAGDGDIPIVQEKAKPLEVTVTDESGTPTSAAMKREDEVVHLTAPAPDAPLTTGPDELPVRELPVGTIGRKELEDLQGEVAGYRAKVDAGDTRAPDITWEHAAKDAANVGEFRLGNLGSADDTASLLGALSRQLPSKGTRSTEELMRSAQAAANDVGEDPEALLALGRTIAGQLGDADSAMATMRTVWSRTSKEINEMYLAKVNWAEADDELVAHAGEAIRNLSVMSQMVQQAKVGLGRGLRVLSLDDADTYLNNLRSASKDPLAVEPVAPREMPPLPRDKEEMKDWFDLWGMTDGDPSKQAAMLQGLLTVPPPGKYVRQSLANFFTASILSAPRTIAMNIVGPGVISALRNTERLTGAAYRSLNPLLSAEERAQARNVARYTAKAYMQTFGDIQDTFRMALRSADLNHTIIGGGGQSLDALTSFGPFTDNLLRAAGQETSQAYAWGNAINFFPRAFARLNNGLDEFAKRMAYQGEVRVNAMVDGAGQGLKGKELQAFVDNALKNSYDEVGHAADQSLLRSAERTTLTSSVGSEGGYVRKFSNALQALRSEIPEFRYIVPVFNVPANALAETLRRTPIARVPGLNKIMFEDVAAELAGERGPVAAADAHGRFLLGGMFLAAGYMMNQQGILTGAGPQDPTDRKVWLQTHSPYSIKIGDQWVSYAKVDLMGGLLAIPATMADMTTYQPNDQHTEDLLWGGLASMTQWFKDRAALQTVSDLMNFGGDPTKDPSKLAARIGGSIPAGFFPAAARTLVTDTTSPYVPMRKAWSDYIKASLPYFANQLEPMRNVLGEPINKASNTLAEAIIPVSLTKAVSYDNDPVLDELDRLYQGTGYGAGADSRSLGYGYFAPQDVLLEDGKSMYYRFMQSRQTMTINGKTLKASLNDLFKSRPYVNGVDADSQSKKTSRGENSRGYMVKALFGEYNDAIKANMAEASPKARAYLTAAAAKRKDDAYLRDVTVEQLVQNPRLYQTHGVYQKGYENKLMKGSSGALMDALKGQ